MNKNEYVNSSPGLDTIDSKASNKNKMLHVTLDDLEYGPGEIPKKGKLKKEVLPEGITLGMIRADAVRIAWPSFIELLLTQLTSMADQMMVGRLPGELGVQALSAVGISANPKFLLMTMMIALNVGATALVARYRGQHNRSKAIQTFRHALIINILLAAFFMILGIILVDPIIKLCAGSKISDITFGYARQYFIIQMAGLVPLCITFTITATLRGIGDSKVPLMYNTLANVINVIFNYLLIYGKFGFPELDVVGASIATVIGQCCAFIFAMVFVLNKQRYICLTYEDKFVFDRHIVGNIMVIGFPALIEQMFMRIGIILNTRIVTALGDIAYATHSVCLNIQAISFMTGQAFGNAATSLMGQSIGKRRYDMAEIYARNTRRMGMLVGAAVGVLLIVFRKQIIGAYNRTDEVIMRGSQILIMVGCLQPFQAIQLIVSGSLRGAGDTKVAAWIMFISIIVVRTSLAYLMVNVLHLGLMGAWYALITDQIIRAVLIFFRYQSGKWRFIRLRGEELADV